MGIGTDIQFTIHYASKGGHGHDDGGADPSRLHDLLPLLRQVTTTRISLFQPMLKKKEIFSRIFSACGIVPRQYKFLLQLKQEICYCFYCFYFLGNASTIVSEAVKWGTRKGRILALWSLLLPWEIQIQAAGCAGDPFTWSSIAVWELLQKQYRALLLLLKFGFVSPKRS